MEKTISKIKAFIITQEDAFFLPGNLDNLFDTCNKCSEIEIVGGCVLDVSPFGKKESFISKTKRTYRIFGLTFFIRYSFKYLYNKIILNKSVKRIFKKYNIPLLSLHQQNINSIEIINKIRSYEPDILLSIAGNQIFKKDLLESTKYGCINLHTALLPKYRGLMPSFWVLKNNEAATGVSVFFVDEGIDSGKIILQKEIPLDNKITQEQLIKKSKKIGMQLIYESLLLINRNEVRLIDNPNHESTYFTFPTKEDVIEFKKIGKRFY